MWKPSTLPLSDAGLTGVCVEREYLCTVGALLYLYKLLLIYLYCMCIFYAATWAGNRERRHSCSLSPPASQARAQAQLCQRSCCLTKSFFISLYSSAASKLAYLFRGPQG